MCKKCLEFKEISEFYKHSKGFRHTCKACSKANSAEWAKNNKEKRYAIVKASRKRSAVWAEYVKEWKRASGDVAKRRAALSNRVPGWLTDEDIWFIKEIYKLRALRDTLTGTDWHVDHIIPLRGKLVCGLHVPLNLQVIEAHINLKKGNEYEISI